MHDAGTGTLIAQQSCGTIIAAERRPFRPPRLPCRKGWFEERLAGKHTEVFAEQAGCSDDLTQSVGALGSPSYDRLPISRPCVNAWTESLPSPEDGHSHILSSVIPNCVSYDPTFSYEVAVVVQDGLRRMYAEQEDVFYYVTLMNENY